MDASYAYGTDDVQAFDILYGIEVAVYIGNDVLYVHCIDIAVYILTIFTVYTPVVLTL